MSYQFDLYGWYCGQGDDARSTQVAPPTLSIDETPGAGRANWTGREWVVWPFVPWSQPVQTISQEDVDAKLTAINEGKNVAMDGGFVHDGKLFDSDSKARLAYLELSLKLSQDATYSTPWKASTGVWVTMDATLFAALQPAYEAHIQSCFAWQAAREQEVAEAVEAGDVEALAGVAEGM